LPVKAALASLVMAAQADAVRGGKASEYFYSNYFPLTTAIVGVVGGGLIGMCVQGAPTPAARVLGGAIIGGLIGGIPVGYGIPTIVSLASGNDYSPTEDRLEAMARQATQATSNAASSLFTAAQNNPGTAALIATAALALAGGTAAYVAHQNKAHSTEAAAREPLTVAHAV
jgi:hypothetical protein